MSAAVRLVLCTRRAMRLGARSEVILPAMREGKATMKAEGWNAKAEKRVRQKMAAGRSGGEHRAAVGGEVEMALRVAEGQSELAE